MTRNRNERYDPRHDMYRNDMDRSTDMSQDRDDGRFSSMSDNRGLDQRGGYGGMDRENFGRDNYDRGGSSDRDGYGQSGGGMDRERRDYGGMNRDNRGMGDLYRGNQGYGGQGSGGGSDRQGYGQGFDRNSGGMGRDSQRYGNMGQASSGYSDDYSAGMRYGSYSDPYQGNPDYRGGSRMGSFDRDMGSGQSGAVSHRGKGPKGYQRSDERLKEMVSDVLEDEHGVDASDIEVQVQNGEVTLTGTVQDRSQKRRAEDCAESVRGIKDVHNQIRVKRNEQAGHGDDTSTVTAKATSSSQRNKGQTGTS
ncbi:BON domain-containing protein [Deinococcus humi]|uniref:Osmotically-inducible protein OsmY n=1 Tax=Deinococcus humi TaxID=662880 RepID=A0A7W8NH94_9DEIO|nr:BON domain-containing protein [Deinococcus humi]MBB5364573.1 osmotically-inducible protein OsmY [Deinococcus humi]GGO38248.1 BON domain-containing protein [Deinococcus humi]